MAGVIAFLITAPFFFGLFYWVVCGVVAAVIASNKNRNGLGFFCLSMFFSGRLPWVSQCWRNPANQRASYPLPVSQTGQARMH